MAVNTITPKSGRVRRALRFFEEAEVFMGYAVAGAWADEEVPDAPSPDAKTIGLIRDVSFTGTSFNTANVSVKLNTKPVEITAVTEYELTALTATTYELRNKDTAALIGAASYPVGATVQETILPGLSILVNEPALTPGDKMTFTVDPATGFRLVGVKHMCVPDPAGTLVHRDTNYRIVDAADAQDEQAYYVYIEATFDYDNLPVKPYRQVGVFTGLTRKTGVTLGQERLLPTEVEDVGVLEVLDNRKVIYRDADSRQNYSFIVEH